MIDCNSLLQIQYSKSVLCNLFNNCFLYIKNCYYFNFCYYQFALFLKDSKTFYVYNALFSWFSSLFIIKNSIFSVVFSIRYGTIVL